MGHTKNHTMHGYCQGYNQTRQSYVGLILFSITNLLLQDVEDDDGTEELKNELTFEFTTLAERILEDQLVKSWKELDRMLFCTKLPLCVIR